MTIPVKNRAVAEAIAAAFVSQFASPATAGGDMGKCCGMAATGQNDFTAGAGTTRAGRSKVDDRGNARKLVPTGTCTTTTLPEGRMGSRVALDRALPG